METQGIFVASLTLDLPCVGVELTGMADQSSATLVSAMSSSKWEACPHHSPSRWLRIAESSANRMQYVYNAGSFIMAPLHIRDFIRQLVERRVAVDL